MEKEDLKNAVRELEKEKDNEKVKNGCIGFVILILIVIGITMCSKCSDNKTEIVDKNKVDTTMLDIHSRGLAEEAIKDLLKAPTTAKFEEGKQLASFSENGNDSIVIVRGSVDSQNSYGAMIRTKYYVAIKYNNGFTDLDDYTIMDSQFIE
jgi:hypothetical protein